MEVLELFNCFKFWTQMLMLPVDVLNVWWKKLQREEHREFQLSLTVGVGKQLKYSSLISRS